MSTLPSKATPPIFLVAANLVAVVALPVRFPVIPLDAVIELSFKTTPSIVTPTPVVSSFIVSTFIPSSHNIVPLKVDVFPDVPIVFNPVIVVIEF